jgi:uncharacterized protein
MELCWDEEKRQRTLKERGLDFARCVEVFSGSTLDYQDDRHDEQRWITWGMLDGKLVAIVRSEPKPGVTRIISMRKATRSERKTYEQEVG